VEQYKSGKSTLFGFFVGQLMKETRGKANPELANEIIRELLDE
jgi:aspartyl-tRNA(Asn)/glutamyl-tRNA(Gln) amidotransferase subunit B